MSVNSSSTNNSSVQFVLIDCDSMRSTFLLSAFRITRGVLLIPLSIFILYLGFQQWRQQRSFKASSHFDIFTYHQAVMELIWGLGAMLNTLGIYFNLLNMMAGGYLFSGIVYFGEIFFHILTCLERYLAVVHPVTYRGLQNSHGARIRNGSIAFSWLVSWIWTWVIISHHYTIPIIPFLSFLVTSFIIVLFCSLSVLHALVRQRPGEGDRNKGQVDQIKLRAFLTVTAILGVVFVWFLAFLVSTAIKENKLLTQSEKMMIDLCVVWFSLPSSVILPLLYLHKKRAFSN